MAALCLIAILGCASDEPPPGGGRLTGYDELEEETVLAGDTDFEVPPSEIDPAEVVPLDLLQGPHHVVRSVSIDHRFLYTYDVESDYGRSVVTGGGLLRKHVLEIEALADYDAHGAHGTKLYALEVANSAGAPIEDTLQILRHPVRTVINVPLSLVTSYKTMREMAEMGRTHLEDDYMVEFIGLSSQKRKWADRMGVDPYSTNPHVQARLSRNGWLSLGGSMTVRLATLPVPAGAASIAMSVVGATSGMNEQVRDVAPEDIRVGTRTWLREEIGVEGEVADRFLEHPWYSPSHQATIVRSLNRMHGAAGLGDFIEMASRADESHEAYAFTRLALMFAEINDRWSPVDELFIAEGVLMAHTADGRAVLPLYLDYGYWTKEVARTESEIVRFVDWDRSVKGKTVLVSGRLSPRAKRELGLRGWDVAENLDRLWLSTTDIAQHEAMDGSDDRILPQFGRYRHVSRSLVEPRRMVSSEAMLRGAE